MKIWKRIAAVSACLSVLCGTMAVPSVFHRKPEPRGNGVHRRICADKGRQAESISVCEPGSLYTVFRRRCPGQL